ncbi:LacI family DNA-binding transcriptional regulator [Curtobacterium ammoniigenes]|uniref:LacI family DNA-binding transcriptional regulator n=1 Tax=Curtobacterium ammoniigenes TaxID=395387 RepID=UPI00083023B2|nr:LacI family DNA-binding transcriptional regulator [Curtobacterium ammoniigenes]
MAQSVRVADIARAAGVSAGTVSKVLNDTGQIREQTREKVLEAARSLGVSVRRRDSSASRYDKRDLTFGVLSTDEYGRFMVGMLGGVEDVATSSDVDLMLGAIRGDTVRENYHVARLLKRGVDGILVTGSTSEIRPSIGRFPGVPVVYALGASDDPTDHSVVPDDEAVGYLGVQHLLSLGRTAIAVIAGQEDSLTSSRRVAGANAALADHAPANARMDVIHGQWTENWGRTAAASLLAGGRKLDGIFCVSDQVARGVLDHLRERGIQVPDDIAVLGVDNWDLMVEASRPTLTSVDLNLRKIGELAASRLLAAARGEPLEPRIEYVRPFIATRQST